MGSPYSSGPEKDSGMCICGNLKAIIDMVISPQVYSLSIPEEMLNEWEPSLGLI